MAQTVNVPNVRLLLGSLIETHVTQEPCASAHKGATRREQVQRLMKRLEMGDFFSAPASSTPTKHLAVDGGLAQHTFHVIRLMLDHVDTMFGASGDIHLWENPVNRQYLTMEQLRESCVIIGLCHDLNKTRMAGKAFYQPNILQSGKRSEPKPFERAGRLVVGGNVESLKLASHYLDLFPDEEQAIVWCEGLFNRQFLVELDDKALPLTHIAHWADMGSTHIIERQRAFDRRTLTFEQFEHQLTASQGVAI